MYRRGGTIIIIAAPDLRNFEKFRIYFVLLLLCKAVWMSKNVEEACALYTNSRGRNRALYIKNMARAIFLKTCARTGLLSRGKSIYLSSRTMPKTSRIGILFANLKEENEDEF